LGNSWITLETALQEHGWGRVDGLRKKEIHRLRTFFQVSQDVGQDVSLFIGQLFFFEYFTSQQIQDFAGTE